MTAQPVSPSYALAPDGAFCITHYDAAPAFSSFLPGVAGLDGAPLWCLYVNRAQAIASFGVHNKDNAIVEFLPGELGVPTGRRAGLSHVLHGQR